MLTDFFNILQSCSSVLIQTTLHNRLTFMTSYNTLLSFHKEAKNRYYTDCEWTKKKASRNSRIFHTNGFHSSFALGNPKACCIVFSLHPHLSSLITRPLKTSETLNRARVSKNSKSSIKTRETETETETEKKLQAKSQIDERRERKNKKQRK